MSFYSFFLLISVCLLLMLGVFFVGINDAYSFFLESTIFRATLDLGTYSEESLFSLLDYLFSFLLLLSAVTFVGVIIYAGALYIIAAGDPVKTKFAKGWMLSALQGAFIVFFSYTFLSLINPQFILFRQVDITPTEQKLTNLYDKHGKLILSTDGIWQVDLESDLIELFDEEGNPLLDEEGKQIYAIIDKDGNQLYVTIDEDGNIVLALVELFDEEGNPVLDKEGNQIYVTTDENGNLLLVIIDSDGNIIPVDDDMIAEIDSLDWETKNHYFQIPLGLLIEDALLNDIGKQKLDNIYNITQNAESIADQIATASSELMGIINECEDGEPCCYGEDPTGCGDVIKEKGTIYGFGDSLEAAKEYFDEDEYDFVDLSEIDKSNWPQKVGDNDIILGGDYDDNVSIPGFGIEGGIQIWTENHDYGTDENLLEWVFLYLIHGDELLNHLEELADQNDDIACSILNMYNDMIDGGMECDESTLVIKIDWGSAGCNGGGTAEISPDAAERVMSDFLSPDPGSFENFCVDDGIPCDENEICGEDCPHIQDRIQDKIQEIQTYFSNLQTELQNLINAKDPLKDDLYQLYKVYMLKSLGAEQVMSYPEYLLDRSYYDRKDIFISTDIDWEKWVQNNAPNIVYDEELGLNDEIVFYLKKPINDNIINDALQLAQKAKDNDIQNAERVQASIGNINRLALNQKSERLGFYDVFQQYFRKISSKIATFFEKIFKKDAFAEDVDENEMYDAFQQCLESEINNLSEMSDDKRTERCFLASEKCINDGEYDEGFFQDFFNERTEEFFAICDIAEFSITNDYFTECGMEIPIGEAADLTWDHIMETLDTIDIYVNTARQLISQQTSMNNTAAPCCCICTGCCCDCVYEECCYGCCTHIEVEEKDDETGEITVRCERADGGEGDYLPGCNECPCECGECLLTCDRDKISSLHSSVLSTRSQLSSIASDLYLLTDGFYNTPTEDLCHYLNEDVRVNEEVLLCNSGGSKLITKHELITRKLQYSRMEMGGCINVNIEDILEGQAAESSTVFGPIAESNNMPRITKTKETVGGQTNDLNTSYFNWFCCQRDFYIDDYNQ